MLFFLCRTRCEFYDDIYEYDDDYVNNETEKFKKKTVEKAALQSGSDGLIEGPYWIFKINFMYKIFSN